MSPWEHGIFLPSPSGKGAGGEGGASESRRYALTRPLFQRERESVSYSAALRRITQGS